MYTLLTQIESTLNSRPLVPLSNDPNELEILTPAHFLIGRTYHAIMEPDVAEVHRSRLTRWQHVQMLHQHFWKKWSQEYLHLLQQRTKWTKNQVSVKEGSMVIVKEFNIPPSSWVLGRVQCLQYGKDGIARVAVVVTKGGVITRTITKLIILPTEEDK